MKKSNKEKVNILWTGGFDSTFRIIELSRENIIIHPIYLIDENRASTNYEINAMNKIMTLLKDKKETKALFDEIEYIKLEDIPKNKKIDESYRKLKKEFELGIQYSWIARLALIRPELELGLENVKKSKSGCNATIRKYGKIINTNDIHRLTLSKKDSSKELYDIFGNIRLPIKDKTEQEMKKIIDDLGYNDVIKEIWFCHTPINNRPCGLCHPCIVKYNAGFRDTIPFVSKVRIIIRKFLSKFLGDAKVNELSKKYRRSIKRKKGI